MSFLRQRGMCVCMCVCGCVHVCVLMSGSITLQPWNVQSMFFPLQTDHLDPQSALESLVPLETGSLHLMCLCLCVFLSLSLSIYIYIYVCVCVCVCLFLFVFVGNVCVRVSVFMYRRDAFYRGEELEGIYVPRGQKGSLTHKTCSHHSLSQLQWTITASVQPPVRALMAWLLILYENNGSCSSYKVLQIRFWLEACGSDKQGIYVGSSSVLGFATFSVI